MSGIKPKRVDDEKAKIYCNFLPTARYALFMGGGIFDVIT